MPNIDCDVVTIGAGVAGLAATAKLAAAGHNVICLEAAGRIGGRIFTVHDPLAPLPIELGAEFVHGLPPEIWRLIRKNGLTAYEHTAEALHIERGRIRKDRQVGEIADGVLSRLGKSIRKKDESFDSYLRRSRLPPDSKKWASVHIEGFNAARKELISTAALVHESVAAGKIQGDRTFRILQGYEAIPLSLLRSIPDHRSVVRLNSAVHRVKWRRGSVEVRYRSITGDREIKLKCRRLIVTVPLGVLQAEAGSRGAIRFDPEPGRVLNAASALQFGYVYRVTFRFREFFWEEGERFKHAGFFVSQDKGFFTWWTMHPVIAPLLTAWSAGSAADRFRGLDTNQIAAQALASLGRILNRKIPTPEAIYFRDWQEDPCFQGAYSYASVGELLARETLAEPVEKTLFFAGEAADASGNASTVHGAIASGIKAADLVMA